MNELSVIIITRNRLKKLMRCLDSIDKCIPGSEIIVVDNGSTDGTGDFLKDNHSLVTIRLLANRGVTVSRNMAIRSSSRKFVMFIDDDAWLEKFDFSRIRDLFSKNMTVGIIAPKLLYPNGDLQESIRSFPTVLSLLWRGTALSRFFPNARWYKSYIKNDSNKIHEVDWSIFACQIVRRELFDIAGLLDERYFYGYEDAEFCRRAKTKGYQTYFWPDAIIYHDYTRSSARGTNIATLHHLASIGRFFVNR